MVGAAADTSALNFEDFNYPNIDLTNLDADSGSRHFLDMVNDAYLTQHLARPTRGSNILDLVLTTAPDMISEVEVREHLANCDHNILAWEIDYNAPVVLTINKSTDVFHKGNYEGFRSYLAGISWVDFFNNCDTIKSWEIFKNVMQEGMDKFIPKLYVGQSKKKPLWMSYKALKAKNIKYLYWKKFQNTKLYEDYVVYKKHLNLATKEIRKNE